VRSERLQGVVLVVVSAIAFGALGVLARVAYDDGADPVTVLIWRFWLATALFAALLAHRRPPRPAPAAVRGLVVMGVCYLLQSYSYFSAVEHASPGLVALLLYTYPALVVVLGAVVLRLRIERRVAAACVVSLAGTALIVAPSAGGGDALGVVFGLAAALVYAGYILLGSRVLERVDPLWASTVIMTTAGTGYLVVVFAGPTRAGPASAEGWAAIVAIALVCTVVAVLTFLAGLARVGPADASTISTIEPVVSVALSAVVVGEQLTGWTLAGGLRVFGSVVSPSRLRTPAPVGEPAPPG
jgi:drug/metabolite transporter (DMT)-like permease